MASVRATGELGVLSCMSCGRVLGKLFAEEPRVAGSPASRARCAGCAAPRMQG